MRQDINGFTLVELVVVLVLIGIISAYVAPKFTGRGGYSELTVQHDLIQSIRFAQQLAMSRTDFPTTLTTSASDINVQYNGTNVLGYPKQLPNDVTLDDANLVFNLYGSAGNTATQINVKGSTQTLSVIIEGTTGYAH